MYVRPTVDLGTYRDTDGSTINYGSRWDDLPEGGPDETYSQVRHPERFAPLQVVAHALIDHLTSCYDVEHVFDGHTHMLTPSDPSAAALQIRFTDLPGVTCRAGIATDLAYFCGCDHCDEDVLTLAEQLEDEIFAVVGGRFREYLETQEDQIWGSRELVAADGSNWMSGGGLITSEASAQSELREQYASVPPWWAAWARRSLRCS